MTDYTKLVRALRCCIPNPPETCEGCTYNTGGECNVMGMMVDAAADAIEALQAEQKKTVTQIFGEEQQKWAEYCTALGNRIKELEQQMPKRGKWYTELFDGDKKYQCSNCLTHWDVETRYCPFCGSKMEVQE